LGIVSYRDGKSFVMADIPGIIEGASQGRGLGLRFLRHIERNSLLLFMVPADADDIKKEYEVLLNELATFNPEMLDKQRVLAITKSDLIDEELKEMLSENLPEDVPCVFISAPTGEGVQELKDILWAALNSEENRLAAVKREELVHRNYDRKMLAADFADWEADYEDGEETDDDDHHQNFYQGKTGAVRAFAIRSHFRITSRACGCRCCLCAFCRRSNNRGSSRNHRSPSSRSPT
jgi:GTP-binding protein